MASPVDQNVKKPMTPAGLQPLLNPHSTPSEITRRAIPAKAMLPEPSGQYPDQNPDRKPAPQAPRTPHAQSLSPHNPALSPDVPPTIAVHEGIERPEAREKQVCSNCHTTETPLWRRGLNGEMMCNACGLYLKARRTARPVNLKRSPRTRTISGNSADEALTPGTCRGTGQCNGTGGSQGCTKCPTYNNRLAHTQHSDDKTQVMISCQNCGTVTTPLWRRDNDGNTICNACGLYLRMHQEHRPVRMSKKTIKRRKRASDASESSPSPEPLPPQSRTPTQASRQPVLPHQQVQGPPQGYPLVHQVHNPRYLLYNGMPYGAPHVVGPPPPLPMDFTGSYSSAGQTPPPVAPPEPTVQPAPQPQPEEAKMKKRPAAALPQKNDEESNPGPSQDTDESPLALLSYLTGDSKKEYLLAVRRQLQDKVDHCQEQLKKFKAYTAQCDEAMRQLE